MTTNMEIDFDNASLTWIHGKEREAHKVNAMEAYKKQFFESYLVEIIIIS